MGIVELNDIFNNSRFNLDQEEVTLNKPKLLENLHTFWKIWNLMLRMRFLFKPEIFMDLGIPRPGLFLEQPKKGFLH